MKKILSILFVITLHNTILINIISCNTLNNTNNKTKSNKLTKYQSILHEPPKNSNGKLINENNLKNEFIIYNNKGYFFIFYQGNNYINELIKNSNYINFNFIKVLCKETKLIYRGNGANKPLKPLINKNTSEITKGNE